MSIKNIHDVRDELIEAVDSVKKDPRRVAQVHEISNACGKIINSVKLELEYAALKKEKPSIKFLEAT